MSPGLVFCMTIYHEARVVVSVLLNHILLIKKVRKDPRLPIVLTRFGLINVFDFQRGNGSSEFFSVFGLYLNFDLVSDSAILVAFE